jgi:hypothetical protein
MLPRKLPIWATCIALAIGCASAANIPGTDPTIKWTGRTVSDHAAGGVTFDWVGVSFSVAVDSRNSGHGNYSTYLKATFDTSKLNRDARTRLKVFVGGVGNYPVPYTGTLLDVSPPTLSFFLLLQRYHCIHPSQNI